MPTEPETATLAEIVRVAAEAADPNGDDDAVAEFVERFEDRDEPVTAVDNVEEELYVAQREIDIDGDREPLRTAADVAVYLAFRRDEIRADREELIRLARRAEENG